MSTVTGNDLKDLIISQNQKIEQLASDNKEIREQLAIDNKEIRNILTQLTVGQAELKVELKRIDKRFR
jgi:hypothetical protein